MSNRASSTATWLRWTSLALITFGSAQPASAATLPPTISPYDLRGAHVYSDLCVEPNSGDIAGLRLFVRPAGSKPRVLAQFAEGGLLQPQPAAWTEKDGVLAVEVSGDVPEARFSGKVTAQFATMKSHAPGAKVFRLNLTSHPDKAATC